MEKKYLSLRGIKEILSEKELRSVVGGSTGSGSGGNVKCQIEYNCEVIAIVECVGMSFEECQESCDDYAESEGNGKFYYCRCGVW